MRLHLLKILPVILVCLPLGGCWDSQELEERLSVTAVAVDQDKGDKDQLVVNMEIPIPVNNTAAGSDGSGAVPAQILTGRGHTFSDAVSDVYYQSNQHLTFGDTRLIIIGEQLAKKGISKLLDAFGRDPEFRRREFMIVAKGDAQHFLKVKSPERVAAEYVIAFLKDKIGDRLILEHRGLNRFYTDKANPAKEPALNYLSADGHTVKWEGLAVFKGTKMLGTLNRIESRSVVQLHDGTLGEEMNTLCIEKPGYIAIKPSAVKRKIRIGNRKGRAVFRITIKVLGDIVEQSCIGDLHQPTVLDRLSHHVAKAYENQAMNSMKIMQKNFRSDICGLGNRIRAFHPKWWNEMNWTDEDFSKADVSIKYEVILKRPGVRIGI
ncbi:germination protein, Ger(x)C family [Marininema mesophilum]|uniref:Germination protein, Ger(X)C family n=1 Tax=Marininema mesophilum TaxID=1048340 RepID=A0A1H2Q5L8_9BACL|nr:Ger(x)C family spore germination protein [Marininema mesophilum]SDW02098.1 germination protein, Ger(x)C family [Marininema mesophilum]